MKDLIKQHIQKFMSLEVVSINTHYSTELNRLVMSVEDSLHLDDTCDWVQVYIIPAPMEMVWHDYQDDEEREDLSEVLLEKVLENVKYISSFEELLELCEELGVKPVVEDEYTSLPEAGKIKFIKI